MTTKLEIGMPCTYCIGSDCYAGRVSNVLRNGKTVQVTLDGLAEWPDKEFTLRQNGDWRIKGQNHGRLLLGKAGSHTDRGF